MSGYLTGWLAGGNPRENRTGTYTVGFLNLDEAAIGAQTVTNVTVTGPVGVTFVVDLDTYEVTANAPFNFEAGATVPLSIVIELDGIAQNVDPLNLLVRNVDEAPTGLADVTHDVNENAAAGTLVATLAGVDPDAGDTSFTYQVQNSTLFEMVGSELRVRSGADLNFEAQASHDITVRVFDGSNNALFTDVTVTVAINDVNEAPSTPVLQGAQTVAENATAGLVGTLAATDPEGHAITWSVVGTNFEVRNGHELHVLAMASLDFEAGATVPVTVRATSQGGLFSETTLTVNLSNVNEAPGDITLSATTISETASAGSVIGSLGATDPDAGGSASFSIVGNDPRFEVVGNELRLKAGAGLDFETAAQHDVTLRVTDQGGLSHDETFTITVTGANEAPGQASLATSGPLPENAAAGTVVGTISAQDPENDPLTYSVTGDARFEVVGHELRVASGASFDFETESSIALTLRASDGLLHSDTVRHVTVGNVQEVPSGLSLSASSVAENSPAGTVVATLTGQDPEGGALSYSLQSGAGFQILGNQLRVASAASLDHEAAASRNVTIRVTDAQGNHADFVRSITITNVNEAPTGLSLSSYAVSENSAAGTVIATLDGTDPDGGVLTYSLISGTGLSIVGNELRVAAGATLNHEATPTIDALIRVTDAGGMSTGFLHSIAVNDVAEAPSTLSVAGAVVAEDAAVGTLVGQVSAQDDDGGPITLQLISGNAQFTLSNGELRLADGAGLDHETQASIDIVIRATDAQNNSRDFTRTINIGDVAEAPDALSPADFTMDENAAGGQLVGVLSATDPQGGALTYAIVSGDGFEILGDELRVDPGFLGSFDFEANPTIALQIRVTDAQGHSADFALNVMLNDVNEAPSTLVADPAPLAEDATAGTVVAILSGTDPDAGDSLSFSLDTPSSLFEILGDELRLKAGAALDFETAPVVDVAIRVTDAGGLSLVQLVTLNINDANEAPTSLALDTPSLAEDAVAGNLVGTLSGIDADAGDSLTFELAEPSSLFEIIGDQLVVAANAAFDFETAGSHDLRVRVTDANGLSHEQVLSISVTDVDEAPFDPTISALEVREGAAAGTVIATLGATDPEGGALTYTLLSGSGLEIVGNELRVVDGSLLSHANAPQMTIDIEVSDAGGNTILFQPVLEVGAPNIAPQELLLSNDILPENAAPGAEVAVLTVQDPDSSEFTFELVSGDGFAIDGDRLVIANGASFDFETMSSVDVEIRATDALGASTVFTRSIMIDNVDEAPHSMIMTGDNVAEGAGQGTLVATLSASDPEGGAITYQLVGDDAFYIDGDALYVADGTLLDHEGQPLRAVTIMASDEAGNASEFTFDINVTNIEEAPTGVTLLHPSDPGLSPAIMENAVPGDVVALLQAGDPEGGPLIYTLQHGPGFIIDGDQLIFDGSIPLDFEALGAIDIAITVTDAQGNEATFQIMLPVGNINEEPFDLSIEGGSVDEDAQAGAVAAVFTAADPDMGDSFTYALDAPSDLFEVVGNELRLRGDAVLDAETTASHDISVTATDAGGLTVSRQFTIAIADVNEAPSGLSITALDVVENAAAGTVIGQLSAEDLDAGDSLSYSLADPSNLFEVVGNELRVKSGAVLDFETAASHSLRLRATDRGGLTTEQLVTVDVADANEAPVIAASFGVTQLRIAENAAAGRQLGAVTVSDPDGGPAPSLSLVGQHAGYFTLDGTQIRLASGASLDHETLAALSFGVRATDIGGLHATQMFSVDVIDVLEAGQDAEAALGGGGGYSGLQVRMEEDGVYITVGDEEIIVPANGQVQLADGTLSFGDGTDAAAIERLYLSMLGRSADGGGRTTYLEMMQDGVSLSQIAQFFLDSPEFNGFVSNYLGAPSYAAVTNTEFATLLYQRILGRNPDGDGLNFWVGNLNAGAISRADMLSGFILSDEARDRFADETQQLWIVDQEALMVRSLYDIALGREPDAGGLAFWSHALENGMGLDALADMIVGSAEFQTMLATMSVTEMVTQFYVQGLERAPEAEGLAFWSGLITSGAADWSDILIAISESPEQQGQFTDYRDGVGIFGPF